MAIKKINDRIRKYNNFLEKLKKKVGIEKTFKLKYFSEYEFWMWGMNFAMSRPTIKQKNWFGRDQEHYGIRNVNNEFCKCARKVDTKKYAAAISRNCM